MKAMTVSLKHFVVTLGSICVCSVLLACSDTSNQQPLSVAAPDLPGPFGVGHSAFVAIDVMRDNRSIALDVWYPVDPADSEDAPITRYPLADGINLDSDMAVEGLPVSALAQQKLLVFSHGYGGTNTQSVALMEMLASHGFVVVSPEHTGNAQAANTDTFDVAAANRVPDVSFVIDTMMTRSQTPGDEFYGRLDESRVGVVGHSFGGMTAVGMAAGWAGAPPDKRVAAIVPISAVIDATLQSATRTSPNAGFSAAQLASINIPVMLIGGTADIDVFIDNNRIAFEQLVNAPAVYRVDIVGATHTHFANICAIGDLLIDLGITQDIWPVIGAQDLLEPYALTCSADVLPIADVVRLQNLYVVAFFKRYLLGGRGYDHYLSTAFATSEPNVVVSAK